MENPRPDKVAVVEEVRDKLNESDAVLFTDYRGLSVGDLAELRASMREAGGEYRVYKNTLVRRAAVELDLSIDDELVGPTAIAFVGKKADGSPGDPVLVAKALQAFAKAHPNLVIKGGLLDARVLDADGVKALATVAPREELLARFAGGLAAPMRNLAALMQALPLNFAYALQALIEDGGSAEAPTAEAPTSPATEEAPASDDAPASDEAPAAGEATAEAADDAAPAAAADEAATDDDNDDAAPAAAEDDTPAAEAAADEE